MSNIEFNHMLESVRGLSPEQIQELRRALDGVADATEARPSAENDLGSIGAMRDDAEWLDAAVAHAMKVREERPWRLSAGE